MLKTLARPLFAGIRRNLWRRSTRRGQSLTRQGILLRLAVSNGTNGGARGSPGQWTNKFFFFFFFPFLFVWPGTTPP